MPIASTVVRLGERSYPIVIADSYRQLPRQLARLKLPPYGCLISHPLLLRRYGPLLTGVLRRAGWRLTTLAIPESERAKSFQVVQQLIGRIAAASAGHTPVLFALGGGVVGDVTGFAAATLRRGVPYVQLPTTLLAQVDSAIGGKTGIDLPQGKNLVGAFYQPRLVWNNTTLLRTLPLRQRRSGLGEILKYAVIADPALWAFLERHVKEALELQPRAVRFMVERCCRIKARVVSQDELDTHGIRARLNFGHTLGHALEAAAHYTRWTHGEAIAIGMCAAAFIAARAGSCRPSLAERIERVIAAYGLPTVARGVSRQAVRAALRYDKKALRGRLRWVLPTRLGRVVVTPAVPPAIVDEALKRYVRR